MIETTWTLGTDFTPVLADEGGVLDGSETVVCAIKRALTGGIAPPPGTPADATAAVSWTPPSGDEKGYWTCHFSAAQSAGLAAGVHLMDALIEKNGVAIRADVVRVAVKHGVAP